MIWTEPKAISDKAFDDAYKNVVIAGPGAQNLSGYLVTALAIAASRNNDKAIETRCLADTAGSYLTISLSPNWWQYLEREAARRGISVLEMYTIEQDALREINGLGVTAAYLDEVSQVSWPAQRTAAQS